MNLLKESNHNRKLLNKIIRMVEDEPEEEEIQKMIEEGLDFEEDETPE